MFNNDQNKYDWHLGESTDVDEMFMRQKQKQAGEGVAASLEQYESRLNPETERFQNQEYNSLEELEFVNQAQKDIRVKKMITLTIGFIMMSSLFLYYRYFVEIGVQCFANQNSDYPIPVTHNSTSQLNQDLSLIGQAVDVSYRFNLLYSIMGWSAFAYAFRAIIEGLYYKTSYGFLRLSMAVEYLFYAIALLSLVFMHWFRLSHSGRVCSGDFVKVKDIEDPLLQNYYMDSKGRLLYLILVLLWTALGAIGLFVCTIFLKFSD
eukprot:403353798